MTLTLLRCLLAGGALALGVLAALVHAQALHPLPPDFLVTLDEIDKARDEMAATLTAIRSADLAYAMFAGGRVNDAIARAEKQLPVQKAQAAVLRREESLGVMMMTRTSYSDTQRDVGAVSTVLHDVRVRSPGDADKLKKLLVQLDGALARLDAALKRFDAQALTMAAPKSPAPAQTAVAPVPVVSTSSSSPAASVSAAPVAPAPAAPVVSAPPPASTVTAPAKTVTAPAAPAPRAALPADFLATLDDIDKSADGIGATVTALRNADLAYAMFAGGRVKDASARAEQQVPVLKAQTQILRREFSPGTLLSSRTAFSDAQRNAGALSEVLRSVTARSPADADKLKKLLAQLDADLARLDATLKRFDGAAMVVLDKRAAP